MFQKFNNLLSKRAYGRGSGTRRTRSGRTVSCWACAGGQGRTGDHQEGSPCPGDPRPGCSKSPCSGCLGRPASHIAKSPPSRLLCKRAVWKLLRTVWKPFTRKWHVERGSVPWLLEVIDRVSHPWIRSIQTHQGSQAQAPTCPDPAPAHTVAMPTRREQGWPQRVGPLSSAGFPGDLSRATHPAMGLSWFITVKQLDIWEMSFHLWSCPRSHKSVGLILCTAYRNKSNVFIIALPRLCSVEIRAGALWAYRLHLKITPPGHCLFLLIRRPRCRPAGPRLWDQVLPGSTPIWEEESENFPHFFLQPVIKYVLSVSPSSYNIVGTQFPLTKEPLKAPPC